MRHPRQVAAAAFAIGAIFASTALPARADTGSTPSSGCSGGACVQSTPFGSTTAFDAGDGENGAMVSEMIVIFGFLAIVWSVPYVVLRRRAVRAE